MRLLKKSNAFLALCIFCCFCQTEAGGQNTVTERAIYRQFEKPGKVLWLKHYKGRFDGINTISVSLAYDGKDCKGMMTYLSSKEKFNLEGDINGNEINLEEKGNNGKVSAVILGTMEGKQIEADWITVENNLKYVFRIKKGITCRMRESIINNTITQPFRLN